MKYKYLIGIDEAGRGPLAGPVSVGVVSVPIHFNWSLINGVGDSKQLSSLQREAVFKRAVALKKEGELMYCVAMVGAKVIDTIGIVPAINKAMARALHSIHRSGLSMEGQCIVKLDGSLKAPSQYLNQETIIKGDQKEKVIGLASIMAKVTRDRYMVRIGSQEQYRQYRLGTHKGYGTKAHRETISTYGASDMHRQSFCKNCLQVQNVVQ